MHDFLSGLNFVAINLEKVYELVYAKRIDKYGLQLSLRVYTSIEKYAGSRGVGQDAIRCEVVWRMIRSNDLNTEEIPYLFVVGRSARVNRTQNWKINLKKRMDSWEEMLGPACPKCKSPTVIRKGKNGEFYGCSTFKLGLCNGTLPIS